jgi:glycerol-1-phosphate dehydrogenase [NAD(P)+]
MRLQDLTPIPLEGHDLPDQVFIEAGCRHDVDEFVSPWLGSSPLCLADPDTIAAVGDAKPAGQTYLLPAHPHADEETVSRVVAAMADFAGICAIGSGTVNDIAKRACAELNRPYVVMGTAASMNGYASGIAAILQSGLKTTIPSSPARAIILDTEILAAAPARLTQAGLGDLLSKPVSDSDWWLANELEGAGYSSIPSEIVDVAVAEAAAAAPGLAQGDPAAHGALGKALVLSGVAMVVAGSSAPASGGEHLLSHLWDMENLAAGRPTRLHGAQVGVSSCISAALYQRLIRLEHPTFSPPQKWEDEAKRIREEHGSLAEVVLPQAQRKHARAQARVDLLRDRWTEIRDGLAARALPTPNEVRAPLVAAGAPHRLKDLGIHRDDAARVFRLARDIRDRLTVLDLGFELGVLPGSIDEILDEAGV